VLALGGILVTSASAAPNFLVTVSKENGTVFVEGVSGAVKVEVLRNGVQVGLAEGTAVGNRFDVNQESAATECWDGFTPEILPGDVVTVTNGDLVDTVPVADIEITDGPVIVGGVGTVKGHVAGTPRPDITDLTVETRSESPVDFRARATGAGPESSDPAGVTGTLAYDDDTSGAFTATFQGFTNDQQRIAFLSSFRTSATLTTAGQGQANQNATSAVREDLAAGPDGCPGRARNAVTIFGWGSINTANEGSPFAISGVSNGATAVTVTVTDSKGTVQTAPTATPGGALVETWQTSLPAGALTGLADGRLTVAATYTVGGTPIRGATRRIRKDTQAPDAPSISPSGGEFTGSRQIDLSAPGSDIVFTLNGTTPGLLNGVPFLRPITLTESATLRAVAIDAFGNISPVAQASFTALTPPGPQTPQTPQAPGVPQAPGAPTVAKAPGAPKIRTASSGAPGGRVTAIARWSAPAEDGGSDVTRYAVTILRIVDGKVVSRKVVTVSGKARSAKLTLRRGTYKFQVKAMNVAGPGPSSARSNTVRAR